MMPRSRSAVVAAQVQMTRPGWVVIWSPWRRMLTAFACFAPDPVVIDEPTPERLVDQMRLTELAYARAAGHGVFASSNVGVERGGRWFGSVDGAHAGGR